MRRVALLAVLALLACRRTHPPGPGAEPEPQVAAPAAPAPAAPENPSSGAAATPGSAAPLTASPRGPVPPDGGTLNGDARGPRPVVVKQILDGALGDVRGCFDGNAEVKTGDTLVNVRFFVEPPGYTGAITVQADAPKAVLDCVRAVYDKLKFPEFRGSKIELAPQFTYWKRGPDGGAK